MSNELFILLWVIWIGILCTQDGVLTTGGYVSHKFGFRALVRGLVYVVVYVPEHV